MELRDFAISVIEATTLDGKLASPTERLTDAQPGAPERRLGPVRPDNLGVDHGQRVKVPRIAGMRDKSQRARILHAFANHELQAAELFGWAILAFPDAPPAFRRGLAAILIEEQKHCQLYIERLAAHGLRFGDLPVTAHFWNRIHDVTTPLEFVCAMGLTFESANLDFAVEYAAAARDAGDEQTAAVLDIVHEDEIRHVAFAWQWLEKMRPRDESTWDAYNANIKFPLDPSRARGKHLDRASRQRAGYDEAFIDALEHTVATRPNGRPR